MHQTQILRLRQTKKETKPESTTAGKTRSATIYKEFKMFEFCLSSINYLHLVKRIAAICLAVNFKDNQLGFEPTIVRNVLFYRCCKQISKKSIKFSDTLTTKLLILERIKSLFWTLFILIEKTLSFVSKIGLLSIRLSFDKMTIFTLRYRFCNFNTMPEMRRKFNLQFNNTSFKLENLRYILIYKLFPYHVKKSLVLKLNSLSSFRNNFTKFIE